MSAVISECGLYRYVLRREIEQPHEVFKPCLFIMLNPSTADAEQDDPTIRRCIAFAKREGCSSLTVVNLFALRATDPSELIGHPDPIGPENDLHIMDQLANHTPGLRIAAWGGKHIAVERGEWLMDMASQLHCLGTTQTHEPRHPLYLRSDTELEEYP